MPLALSAPLHASPQCAGSRVVSGITGRAVSLSGSPGPVGTDSPGPRRGELLAQLCQTTLNCFPKPQLRDVHMRARPALPPQHGSSDSE